MILKEADDRAEDLAELKRLREASPASFRAAIQKQIDNIHKGIAGEREAAHFLKREFGHSGEMLILHDLRIGVDGDYAQIDHLVIHRVQATAWVLETKNYSGRLSCDEHGDWTVWRSGKPTPIASPSNQASRQGQTLRLWLQANGIRAIQKIQPVILISPISSVNRNELSQDTHVVKSDNFGEWWRKQTNAIGFSSALGIVGRHVLSGLSTEEFLALGKRLVDAHVPATYDWRAMLRLPRPSEQVEPTASEQKPVIPDQPAGDAPHIIVTPHGKITITRIPDGRYALRNDKNEALVEIVKKACKGRAQWNPRFRNWLISEDKLSSIVAVLARSAEAPA